MSIYKGSQFIAGTPDLSEYAKSSDVNSLDAEVVKLSGNQTIAGTKTFSSAVKCAGSATTGTAITTSAISKSANGYVKLGNGIIIQWGKFTTSSSDYQNFSVTFPTAFSNTNYSFCFQQARNGAASLYASQINSKTTTGVTGSYGIGNLSGGAMWIAIGY